MAARSCMRLCRLFLSNSPKLSFSSCPNRTFHVSKSLKSQSSLFSGSVPKYCTNIKAPYSSQSALKSSNVKILTDAILKYPSKLSFSSCPNRTFHVSKSLKSQSSLFSCSVLKYCTNIKAPYSSQSTQKSSNVKILTDEILKAAQPKQSSDKEDESKGSEDPKKSDAFQKKAMKYTFLAFGSIFTGMLGLAIYEWGAPPVDEEGNVIEDEFSSMPTVKAHLLRTYKEMMYYKKLIKEPSSEKLLPEPLTEPYFQPPYTLVLEMTGVLVHPDWTYQTGWRFKKRPGVDYFLQQAGPPLFEIVIYTSEQAFTAFPIIDSLDPNGYIMYRLFRDATHYMDGHHVKDLACLNRDLSKVIFVDWSEKSFKLQPKNALKLKKWAGDDDDRTLYDLANLLRAIATSNIDDVRTVLEYYSQFDDPIQVFKENQRKLQEEEEKRMSEERGKKPSLVGTWSGSLLKRR